MTIIEILQSKMSLEEAKMAVYRLYSSEENPGAVEINQIFYPELARAVTNTGLNALAVVQKFFKSFDQHAQEREARILEAYLKQLGSQ